MVIGQQNPLFVTIGLRVFSLAQHMEAALRRFQRKLFNLRLFDMDMGLAFQPDQQFSQPGRPALGFHLDAAVGQVSDPSGQIQVLRQVKRGIPEPDMLHLAVEPDAPSCLCRIQTVSLLQISKSSGFGNPDEWGELKQEDYFKFKNEGAKKMLRILKEKTGIDLVGHIEEMEVASPWTFARDLGSPEGSAYGYEARDWDGMMARMMMISSDYPIKGLRPIGAAGPRSDGYSATIICGQLMAFNALKDLKEWSEGGESNV